ncbi:MAG: hypothetical protein AUG51_07610 [Acidobacteria bacterium 13_1_20CM_3_53_8]|nr:MAG: hypothetical protein AUG51_07610 [Acidobacteria bacterium 13_1_20CM_3_53_8]
MKKVGLLVGREQSFPAALIESINERGQGDVVAEFIKLDGVRLDYGPEYDLIIDRISHEIPFYRAFLKKAALEGAIIINNPFWWSADDKFFNYSLAAKLGVAVPKTVLLPQKDYIEGVTSESLRNLEYPLDWQAIVDYTGLPAILKPFDGGGWKNVSRVNTLEELWYEYDQTGTLCMTLQEFINFDQFVRCYCIGQEEVMIMAYDPRKPYLSGEQYIHDPNYLAPELAHRVAKDVQTLCRALGYDINTVEFAIKDGIPYAIDFMNPAPDADVYSVGEFYHKWVTNTVTDLVFKRLSEKMERPNYRWDSFLNPESKRQPEHATHAVASATEQAARTIIPEPVREISEDIATGAREIMNDTASAVSEAVSSVIEPKPKNRRSAKSEASAAEGDGTTARKSTARKAPTARAKKAAPEM